MDKDCTVIILFRYLDVSLGHIHQVETPLGGTHLVPLLIVPVTRMDPTDGLHGQEHDQLKVGHMTLNRFSPKGLDKFFSGRHERPLL